MVFEQLLFLLVTLLLSTGTIYYTADADDTSGFTRYSWSEGQFKVQHQLARSYCAVQLPFETRLNDGSSIRQQWSPCSDVFGDTATTLHDAPARSLLPEAQRLCQQIGFAPDRLWQDCAGHLWRDHWIEHQNDVAVLMDKKEITCPNYEPLVLWRYIDLLRRDAHILEVNLSDGCFFAEKYLMQNSNSSVMRIPSVQALPAMYMGWRARKYTIIHVIIDDESDECNLLDGLWECLDIDGVLTLQQRNGLLLSPNCVNEFLASHPDALVLFETRSDSFLQVKKMPKEVVKVATRRDTPHVYVVALSMSSAWDGRWLKYIDFLATSLPSNMSASLTIERDVTLAPCITELASRRQKLGEQSMVVVLLGIARSQHYTYLQLLAQRLTLSQAPAIGLVHLQSWRPWEFEGSAMLQSCYEDPAFGFIRRQHYFEPLAKVAPATPLAPAFYAEHLYGEHEQKLVASQRSIRCLFAASVSTPGQRQNRGHLLDVITSHGLPCRVGAIHPGPSKVLSIGNAVGSSTDESFSTDFDASTSTLDDLFDVPFLPLAVRAPVEATAYVKTLRDSAIVLCPAGDDLETFRFWETLAAGGIPVIVVGPNETSIDFVRQAAAFGLEPLDSWRDSTRCPFPVLDSWDQLPALLSSLFGENESNHSKADLLQAKLLNCYEELMVHVRKDISGEINKLIKTNAGFIGAQVLL